MNKSLKEKKVGFKSLNGKEMNQIIGGVNYVSPVAAIGTASIVATASTVAINAGVGISISFPVYFDGCSGCDRAGASNSCSSMGGW
jgi:bacteriocin-like protein